VRIEHGKQRVRSGATASTQVGSRLDPPSFTNPSSASAEESKMYKFLHAHLQRIMTFV
jgi:hypothetical protein